MKLYAIGGLGADHRVFTKLELIYEIIPLVWIDPIDDEDLKSYCLRLSNQINSDDQFGIIGVSFGGIIAVELNKILNPRISILISSVAESYQLPKMRKVGKYGMLDLLPDSIIKPPQFILNFLFGTKEKDLLRTIISDTDPKFIRWALTKIINWESDFNSTSIHRIHGTKDRLIPIKGEARQIQNGGHFMIVDNASEVSRAINELIKRKL